MLVLEVNKKTLFAKLTDVYPECFFYIGDEPNLFPLMCLQTSCPRNMNCMETLAKRVKYIFDAFTDAVLLVLYFKHKDRPQSIRAGIFWRDMSEPRVVTVNPYAWEKFKDIGTVYEWELPNELFSKDFSKSGSRP